MNQEIVNRLEWYRQRMGVSSEDFAQSIDLTLPFVTEEGFVASQLTILRKKFPELSLNWVLFGAPPTYSPAATTEA